MGVRGERQNASWDSVPHPRPPRHPPPEYPRGGGGELTGCLRRNRPCKISQLESGRPDAFLNCLLAAHFVVCYNGLARLMDGHHCAIPSPDLAFSASEDWIQWPPFS